MKNKGFPMSFFKHIVCNVAALSVATALVPSLEASNLSALEVGGPPLSHKQKRALKKANAERQSVPTEEIPFETVPETIGVSSRTSDHHSESDGFDAEDIPDPYAPLKAELKGQFERYQKESSSRIENLGLIRTVTFKPYGAHDPEFSDLYRIVTVLFETFGQETLPDEQADYSLRARATAVENWFAKEFSRIENQMSALKDRKSAHQDGILDEIEAHMSRLEEKKSEYTRLYLNVMWDLQKTQEFVSYTKDAIQKVQEALVVFKNDLKDEKNSSTRSSLGTQIQTFEQRLRSLEHQIFVARVALNSKYPSPKPQEKGSLGLFASLIDFATRSAASRTDPTPTERTFETLPMPDSLTLTADDLTDKIGDREHHYNRHIRNMLCDDQGPGLKNGQITIEVETSH